MDITTSVAKQSHWILGSCPCTGDEVVGSNWSSYIALTNRRATWWYCPACQGWHVLLWSTDYEIQEPCPEKIKI